MIWSHFIFYPFTTDWTKPKANWKVTLNIKFCYSSSLILHGKRSGRISVGKLALMCIWVTLHIFKSLTRSSNSTQEYAHKIKLMRKMWDKSIILGRAQKKAFRLYWLSRPPIMDGLTFSALSPFSPIQWCFSLPFHLGFQAGQAHQVLQRVPG